MDILYVELGENTISVEYKAIQKVITTDTSITRNGRIINSEAITSELYAFIAENNVIKKYICFTIISSEILMRFTSVKLTKTKEINDYLSLTAKRSFPAYLESYTFNYSILHKNGSYSYILMGIAPNDLISSYIKISSVLNLRLYKIQIKLSYQQSEDSIFLTLKDKFVAICVFSDKLCYSKFLYKPSRKKITLDIERIMLHSNASVVGRSAIFNTATNEESIKALSFDCISHIPFSITNDYKSSYYLDFVPDEYKRNISAGTQLKRRLTLFVFLLVATIVFHSIAAHLINKKDDELKQLITRLSQFEIYADVIDENTRLLQKAEKNVLNELTYGFISKSYLIQQFSSSLPEYVFLSDIKFSDNSKVEVKATAASRENALLFAKNIASFEIAKDVNITSLSIEGQSIYIELVISLVVPIT